MARYPKLKNHNLVCPICGEKQSLDLVDKMFLKSNNVHSISLKCDCDNTVMVYLTSTGFYSIKRYNWEQKINYFRNRRLTKKELNKFSSEI